ncbi:MAG: hypothetical protein J0I07_31915, partial [Myxococcales bacterium]|nr:hypothetical protein [Myxococcales bacterium]
SLPFTADTVSGMLVAVAYDEPAMLVGASGEQGVPFELARIAHACLSKDPSGRPADVAALAKALAPFAGADGLTHAKRAEAALSTPPDVTMTVEPDEGRGDATLAAKPAPPPERADRRPAPSPSTHDQNRRTRAIERRRAGALATVGLAALLALVGLLVPASPAPGAASAREVVDPSAGALPAAVPVTVLPPRSPSFLVEQPPRTHQPSPSSTAPSAPPPPPPLDRAPRTNPSSTPATRGRTKQVSPSRPRAALSVREDPYARGFTHPTRLSERRK